MAYLLLAVNGMAMSPHQVGPRTFRRAGALLLITVTTACGGDSSEPVADTAVASVTVASTLTTLTVDDSVRLTATAMTAGGVAVAGATMSWASGSGTVATVDASGMARALAAGTALITATAEGKAGNITLTVVPRGATGSITLSLLPTDWSMETGGTLQLQAVVNGTSNTAVAWSVNGAAGGNSSVGTVTTSGLYTAPASPPASPVRIRAASTADLSKAAELSVTVVAPSTAQAGMTWNLWEPRVLDLARQDSMRLTVTVVNHPSSVTYEAESGAPVLLLPLRTGTYGLTLSAAQATANYRAGDDHHVLGAINVSKGAATSRYNLLTNVRHSAIPPVTIVPLAADAQLSAHVLNLRVDTLYLGRTGLPELRAEEVLRRMYMLLPDDFDFVALVEQVQSPRNRFYMGVRNNTAGLGFALIDNGAQYGSSARLQGGVHYPIDNVFDLGEGASIHEIGHRWVNYLNHAGLSPGRFHWPISDLAYGIMGYSPMGGQGLNFPFRLTPQSNGDYTVTTRETATEFNDLELYLMGLIPGDSVGPHFSFVNQAQADQLRDNGVLRGPITTIRIEDIIAQDGLRTPTPTTSQKAFRMATVVLSRGRLLTAEEQAFFDHMAARGEARTVLNYTSGLVRGTTKPFYLATGGRATLSTTMR